MTIDWAHNLATYQQLWGERLGVSPLPLLSETGGAPTPYVVAEVAAINKRASAAEHQAAVEFVRFLLDEPAQRQLWSAGRLPALGEISAGAEGWAQPQALLALHAQAQRGLPALNVAEAATIERTLRQMQRDVLRGLVSPSDAVTAAAAALRALTPSPPKQP
jgi:ABC-type glycerol-3-phosphate transport system substrate-binding protein